MRGHGDDPGRRLRYNPALDGLRGVAVALVLLYHGSVAQARGGYLGVTMFFTLSGFLITALLLAEHDRAGRISFRRFWGRRARRLVPALLLCFPLAAILIARSPQAPGHGLMGDAFGGALWFENWRLVLAHQSYADLFALPSPFQHFWSLAVEEQYYLVFPILAAIFLARRRRILFALLLGQLVVVSVALGELYAVHSPTITRAYYGTDSRIGEILVGALLALALIRGDGPRVLPVPARRALDIAGGGAAATLGLLVVSLPYGDLRLFRGGLLLTAACTAVIIAAVSQPGSRLARVLSLPPLVRLGLISYGVYLFHWPLFLMLTTTTTGLTGLGLLAVRVGVTLAVATASYVILEAPIRRGRLRTAPAITGWVTGATAGLAAIALAAGILQLPSFTSPTPPAAAAAPSHGGGAVSMKSAKGKTAKARRGVAPVAATMRGTSSLATRPAVSGRRNVTPATTRPSQSAVIPQEFVGAPDKDYTQPPRMPVVPPGATKVLVVGDSIGDNLGRGLTFWSRGRRDVVVYNLAIPACPVSRGGERRIDPDTLLPVKQWCEWWDDPSTPRYQAMQKFAPDVVFVEDGINAVFERKLDSWSDWEKPGVTQFDDWMTGEYQTFVNDFRGLGAKVVIANAPCGDWSRNFTSIPDGPQRVSAMDDLVYPAVVGDSSADFFSEVCPGGQYSDTVDGVQDARPDGFHFTDEAATALARDWLGPLLLKVASRALPLPAG